MIVGDGNFSFSLSFLKRLDQLNQVISTFQCTSYDSYDSLLLKYPEVTAVFHDLLQFNDKQKFVYIHHNIDATSGLYQQLSVDLIKFQYIIFNFPHLGKLVPLVTPQC